MSDPALSAQEWSDLRATRRGRTFGDGFTLDASDGVLRLTQGAHGVTVPEGARLALAALALHGEGGGFTRDDLSLLRWIFHGLDSGEWGGFSEEAARLARVMAKVEALLPPEGA